MAGVETYSLEVTALQQPLDVDVNSVFSGSSRAHGKPSLAGSASEKMTAIEGSGRTLPLVLCDRRKCVSTRAHVAISDVSRSERAPASWPGRGSNPDGLATSEF
jgi:hypothetical protein